MYVQTVLAKPAVKAFDLGVVNGRPRPPEIEFDCALEGALALEDMPVYRAMR